MSTVKSTTMQCDELTAKNGAGIPNTLVPLTADAYGCVVSGTAKDTVNVSSVTSTAKGFAIAFINPMATADYSITALRNGALSNDIVYSVDYDAPSKVTESIQMILRASGVAGSTCDNWCFLVFSKGGTS